MGKHGCAVFNCEPNKQDSRHRFPNPVKFPELFLLWIQVIGNVFLENKDKNHVYNTYRVCSKHFPISDFVSNNHLKKGAYPQLFLPKTRIEGEPHHLLSVLRDHDSCSFQEDAHMNDFSINDESILKSIDSANNYETEIPKTPSPVPSSHLEQDSTCPTLLPKTNDGLLRSICVRTVNELTPKAKSMYKQALHYKRMTNRMLKRKNIFKDRLKSAEKVLEEKSFLNLASTLTSTTYNFFKRQIECAGKKSKGRRFSVEDKILALALYKQSPSAYKLLSSIFALPSRTTIQKLLSRVPIKAGINDSIFSGLKGIGKNMPEKNKVCVLMFDEMALSSHLQYNQHFDEVQGFEDFGTHKTRNIANHVQVYMLRGIASNWKQPLAYTFVDGGTKSPKIKHMLKKLIRLTKEAGFNVIATVCDQGTNNVSAINDMVKETQRLTQTHDYVFEVDHERVIPIFDAPHLLKSVRNNLVMKDIYFKKDGTEKVASWDHILKAYQIDAFSGHLRAMPKLTESHVNKDKIKKMKVSICAQVFSHTVAATLNLLIGKENESNPELQLSEDARDTAEFVKFFDNLFDSVNGSAKIDKCGKPLRTAVSTITKKGGDIHLKFWTEALPVLSTMYVLKDGKKVILPCFKNWQRTLKGFILIRKKLRELGIHTFKIRHINQDPLEIFFGKIRQRGQQFTKPTCSAFEDYYKSLLINNFVSKHSIGSNCEMDNTNILLTLQRFVTQGLPEETELDNECDNDNSSNIHIPDSFDPLKPLESAALGYVAGYIVKVRGIISECCVACKHNVLKRDHDVEDFHNLIKAKEYGGSKTHRLKYCNSDFIKNLIKVYNITRYILKHMPHRKNLLKFILKIVKKEVDFNFIICEHSAILLDNILHGFAKLVIFNYFKGITNVMNGKDQRSFPPNTPAIYVQARDIFKKKQKYKSKVITHR